MWQAPSPRPGGVVNWETLAKREEKKKDENIRTLDWLQGQWLPLDVKMMIDAYEKSLEKVSLH